ncbi:hypothetical protein ABZT14_14265, partial [Streptomyces sp. NPDC005438]
PHHRPTPQQVIDYLTGPHTTPHTLTQNDWLPGPLADELSERASELARLETNGGDQAGTPAEVSADRATPVRPRDPREGPYDTPTQQITVAPRQRSPEPPAPPPAGPPEKRQRSDTPTPAGEGSAEPEPGGEARPRPWRRRLLVGAAALVLALLAAAVWWPGLWTGGKNANGDPDPSPSPTQAEGAVPGKFIGSWQGELTTRRGLPGGTLVVTLRQGREGQVVGTSKVSLAGASCPGKWVLKKATANRITVETRARDTAVCSGGSDREEATYRDGRLEFRSHDERGGRPTGTLERLE